MLILPVKFSHLILVYAFYNDAHGNEFQKQ